MLTLLGCLSTRFCPAATTSSNQMQTAKHVITTLNQIAYAFDERVIRLGEVVSRLDRRQSREHIENRETA